MLKMWRGNKISEEWAKSIEEIARLYMESEWPDRLMDVERKLRSFMTDPNGPISSVWEDEAVFSRLLDLVIELEGRRDREEAARKRSRTMLLKRVRMFTTPEGGYAVPTVPERYSHVVGYEVVHGADLEARDNAFQRFQQEWVDLTEEERQDALRDAHTATPEQTDTADTSGEEGGRP